jgi:hypothetical protein
MKLYLAGSASRKVADVIYAKGWPKLWSFLNEKRQIENAPPGADIMVDSGAHSWNKNSINRVGMASHRALPPLKEYAADYLKAVARLASTKFIFVELDVYGNLPMADINAMAEAAAKVIPKDRWMRVYHPIGDNGSMQMIRDWIKQGHTRIGLGKECRIMLKRIFTTFPDIAFHGFAQTSIRHLEIYPYATADSTTWKAASMFGGHFCPDRKRYFSKEDMVKMAPSIGRIKCHCDSVDIVNATNMMRVQQHLTDLWKKRGYKWP